MGTKISFIMNLLLYYLIVLPLSWLPLRIIYIFTNFISYLFIHYVPYREKIVLKNIKASFPFLRKEEIIQVKNNFYTHLGQLIAESIKNLSISKRILKKRFRFVNPEILDELYAKNKNVILVSGHFNNWEWMITSMALHLKHHCIGIGMPLKNGFWDKKLNERRARFGMTIGSSANIHELFESTPQPYATLLLSDQSPGDERKAYWMNFLYQQTPVIFGCEYLAHKYDHAVVYFEIKKMNKGYYDVSFELITDQPRTLKWGEITEAHTKLLEKSILKQPSGWLWSHNRWKKEVPRDLEQLKESQCKSFEEKFN
jgi:KDO2-lipid IV(A) lauroyltransferase